ncbi:MAG: sugar kinase [Actinobacteria bacterium]|nr:sugar kinase [Actinomycetota bacterium]
MHTDCICHYERLTSTRKAGQADPPQGEKDDVKETHLDLVSLGETMATFVRADTSDSYRLITAGAESNVAAGMATLGCRTQWHSRLGTDELGAFVADALAAARVDVVAERDPDRPTGTAVKEVSATGSRMRYYRAGSAASRLDLLDTGPAHNAARLHLTGVTPALSPENRELIATLMSERGTGTSFDINYRPTLWSSAEHAASVLIPLARSADLVFIGDDEARALLGSDDINVVASAIGMRPSQELVLKRGPAAAELMTTDDRVTEPAHRVDVVDLTGAGDAFAAGYLAASVWGWPARARLRLGHLLASRVVGVLGDTVPGIDRADLIQVAADLGQSWPNPMEETQP